MRKLVDDRNLRDAGAGWRRHPFPRRSNPGRDVSARDDLQTLDERHRVLAAVRLEISHDDVHAAILELVRLREHLKGLADTGSIAQKNLQSAFHARP